jgi:hypothetical protein
MDRTPTLFSTILAATISTIDLIRIFCVHQLLKRDQADKNPRSLNPVPPHIPSTGTMLPPTAKEGQGDCSNYSILPITLGSDPARYILADHGWAHIMEKPSGNQNKPRPMLPALPIPQTLHPLTVYKSSRSLNNYDVAQSSTIQQPAGGTVGHLLSTESNTLAARSSTPHDLDNWDLEHDQALRSTIAFRSSNSNHIGEKAPASKLSDLLFKSTHNPALTRVNRAMPQVPASASASTASTLSRELDHDNLSPLLSSSQKIVIPDPPAQQPSGTSQHSYPPFGSRVPTNQPHSLHKFTTSWASLPTRMAGKFAGHLADVSTTEKPVNARVRAKL